jgi:hypothetical protein
VADVEKIAYSFQRSAISQSKNKFMRSDKKKIDLFLENHALKVSRFSKSEMRSGKTPDFKVHSFSSDELLFYCEVKSIAKDEWLDNQIANVPPGEIAGGLRNDPIFNRLTDDIYEAVKQFDAVNPDIAFPNVLAFVNHDSACGFLDLIAVLTGNAMTEESGAIPIYRQYSEGRIKDKKDRIYLFIWLDDYKPFHLLFSQTNENHHKLLCDCLNMNPAEIIIIDR